VTNDEKKKNGILFLQKYVMSCFDGLGMIKNRNFFCGKKENKKEMNRKTDSPLNCDVAQKLPSNWFGLHIVFTLDF